MSFKRDSDEQNGPDIYISGNTIQGNGGQQLFTKVRKTAHKTQDKLFIETDMDVLNDSVHFTADGRRVTSALKRSSSSPSVLRKSVSFSIPDAAASDSSDEDFLPKYVDEISPSIDAIAKAQKMTSITNPRTITLMPKNVQPIVQPILPVRIAVPNEHNKERLPTLHREQQDLENGFMETDSPATFKSLRNKLRGMAPVRVRKSEPEPEPLKICLHCQISMATHTELKKIIENAIHYFKDAKVTCLQFDPLAVWSGDPAAQSRWIISLSDTDACNYLTRTGLNVHGEHYRIECYDNVVLKEFEVYQIKKNILQGGKGKILTVA